MKNIFTIILLSAITGLHAQVIIGDAIGTATTKTSVLLEFATGAGQNKGIIVPYVRELPTAAALVGGAIVLDAVDATKARMKYYNGTAWIDLSGQDANITSTLTAQPAISVVETGAKAIIGARTSSADGVLVLESIDKAMVLPTVADVANIQSPSPGMMVYVKGVTPDFNKRLAVFNGSKWSFWKLAPVPPVSTVTSPTGKIWIDRNLGATQVAASSTDAASYGDLYQWGRLKDGHQIRTSPTTTTLSSGDVPGNGDFILTSAVDWRSPKNDNLWQGVSGTNNPCPSGFRLPTQAELAAEVALFSTANMAGAFSSVLKFPAAGYRVYNTGTFLSVNTQSVYWTSTVSGNNSTYYYFQVGNVNSGSTVRAYGFAVRCIKD